MCRGIIGRKIGMTGVFSDRGEYVPVTVVEAGPCVVTQIKTVETDGYNALQLGFLEKKASKINKPLAGHFKKSGGVGFAYVREMAVDDPSAYALGQVINAELFSAGEKVHVAGLMKGRGFAGVVKRHGFSGGDDTHGCHSHRVPGSIGTSAWPSKVFKGRKLPGRYGNTRITTKNLKIFDIQPETNLILIKGAVPGSNNGLVEIRKINA
ncbi:MAG: 50S ribosomal protein L3 [Thermodesulfobacteriota bacterium]|nr:50S ribosomal protein L3 [Thermodesulfobacteriota bacterium]